MTAFAFCRNHRFCGYSVALKIGSCNESYYDMFFMGILLVLMCPIFM